MINTTSLGYGMKICLGSRHLCFDYLHQHTASKLLIFHAVACRHTIKHYSTMNQANRGLLKLYFLIEVIVIKEASLCVALDSGCQKFLVSRDRGGFTNIMTDPNDDPSPWFQYEHFALRCC